MGGETCNPNSPRSDCGVAMQEMRLFHYTFMNKEYHPDVIASWEAAGCLDDVRHRLGCVSCHTRVCPGASMPEPGLTTNTIYASGVV